MAEERNEKHNQHQRNEHKVSDLRIEDEIHAGLKNRKRKPEDAKA